MIFGDYAIEAKYQIVQKENSNEIQIIFEPENDTLVAEFLVNSDKSIYLKYYKTMEGVSHHIDEINRFYFYGENKYESINCSMIVMDSIQSGQYFVHFENKLLLNNSKCDTVFIGKPGLTRVEARLDLRSIDKINVGTKDGESIPLCTSLTDYMGFCVDILGFNQEPRNITENRFSEKIEGDILMFNINSSEIPKELD